MSLVYLYDGSYDGLLTAVFEAYARKQQPEAVAEEENLQVTFGQHVVRIPADEEKARRVEKGVLSKMGSQAHQNLWKAYLSGFPDKGTAIYHYIRRGMEIGRRVYNDIAHPAIFEMDRICRLVGKQTHFYIEFLRFSEMEGGVFYAKISPEHQIVPLIMPHFVDRFNIMPFLIHDDTHHVAGVYNLKEWEMVDSRDMTIPDITADEVGFRRMWRGFYDAIAIKERFNPRCRMGHMPKKYWSNMTEMLFVETPYTKRIEREGARNMAVGTK